MLKQLWLLKKNLSQNLARQFSTANQKSVAFIGMGSMGFPMASNLAKNGFKVNGYDLYPNKDAEKNGINVASSVADACRDVDYVVTSLPKNEHVMSTMFDANGVLASAKKGTMVMDVSTVTPMLAQDIGKAAREKGLIFCDTPMAGGTVGAKKGSLVFMVGADTKDEYEHAKICLEGMGQKFFHCGEVGAGLAVKISHNLTLGINMIASAEGMILGERLGIDPKVLMQILQASTSANACMGIYNPRPGNNPDAPASRDYEDGFQTGLMKKDMNIALQAAAAVGASTEIAQKAHDYYENIEANGLGTKDFGYVYQYLSNDKEFKKL